MRRGRRIVVLCGAIWIASNGTAAAAPEHDEEYEHETEVAQAIADDYADGNAKYFRWGSTTQLATLADKSREELVAALDAYLDVAAERGIQGLEGTIASTAAALSRTGYDGWVLASARMADFSEIAWVDEHSDHLNAYIAVKRPNQPAVHYLSLPLARGVLDQQLSRGTIDIDGALGVDMCSEAGIAEFAQRWGAEVADMLASLCDRMGGAATSGLGGAMGVGPIAEGSLFDCMTDHEPTRAERVEQGMQDCFESMQGGGGDALAQAAGVADGYYHNASGAYEVEAKDDTDEYGPYHGVTFTDYDNSTITYRDYPNGAERYIETDPEGQVTVDIHSNVDGSMEGVAYDDGVPTESVVVNSDGSYSVTSYDDDGDVEETQHYDTDGNPVDGDGNPETPDADDPGMEWGDTAECRELALTLMFERAETELEARGISPTVVNPSPEGPVEEAGDLDCLELTGGMTMDASFACHEELVLCAFGEAANEDCICEKVTGGMSVEMLCGLEMICDGPVEVVDGVCHCGITEVFVDEGGGPGPQPIPIDHEWHHD